MDAAQDHTCCKNLGPKECGETPDADCQRERDFDIRQRAREICNLIGKQKCADGHIQCHGENCYIWELIEMGRRGSAE